MDLTILIVDDEADIRNTLHRNLKKWATKNKVELSSAESADEAMKFLEKEHRRTAVIISDYRMPKKSGAEFLKEVAVQYPSIISIMLTGHAETSAMGDLIEAGINAFIEKPWNNTALISEISKALELYRLRLFMKHQGEIQKTELELVQNFQNSFFHVDLPENSYFKVNLLHRSAKQNSFGSDYYDILALGDEKYMLLLGDISGHSLRASFLAAILKANIYSEFLKKQESTNISPASLLTWLNQKVFDLLHNTPDVFISFSASLIDGKTGMVTLANGGQPPSLLISPKGVTEACPPLLPMGIENQYTYTDQNFQMEPGDLLFLCTDGISPSGKNTRYIDKTVFYELLKEMRINKSKPDFIINTVSVNESSLMEDEMTIISLQMN